MPNICAFDGCNRAIKRSRQYCKPHALETIESRMPENLPIERKPIDRSKLNAPMRSMRDMVDVRTVRETRICDAIDLSERSRAYTPLPYLTAVGPAQDYCGGVRATIAHMDAARNVKRNRPTDCRTTIA